MPKYLITLFTMIMLSLSACGGGATTSRTSSTLGAFPVNPYSNVTNPYNNVTNPYTAPAPVLGTISGLLAVNNADRTISLKWNPAANATSYNIRVSNLGTAANPGVNMFLGTSTQASYIATIPTWTYGASYTFSVEAVMGTSVSTPATVSIVAGHFSDLIITGQLPYNTYGATISAYVCSKDALLRATSTSTGSFSMTIPMNYIGGAVGSSTCTISIRSLLGTMANGATAPSMFGVAGQIDITKAPPTISTKIDESTTVMESYIINKIGTVTSANDSQFYTEWQNLVNVSGLAGEVSDQLALATLYSTYLSKNMPSMWLTRTPADLSLSVFQAAGKSLASNGSVLVSSLDNVVTNYITPFAPATVLTPAYVATLPATDAALSFKGTNILRLGSLRSPNAVIVNGSATLPIAPTKVVATSSNGSSTLSWLNDPTVLNYNLYQNGVKVGSVTKSPYTFTGLVNNQAYNLGVSAVNAIAESSITTAASATPIPIPSQPIGLSSVYDNATSTITLSWGTTPQASSYNIYLNGVLLQSANTAITYTYSGAIVGLTYAFSVTAVNTSGESVKALSSITPTTTPPAPTGFVSTTKANGDVVFTWNLVNGATNYTINRDYGAAITNTTLNTATFVGLQTGVPHVFDLTATLPTGVTAKSTLSVTVPNPGPLPAPISVTATTLNPTTLHLTWSAISGAVSYRVTVNGAVNNVASTFLDAAGLVGGATIPISVSGVDAVGTIGKAKVISSAPAPVITLSPANLMDKNNVIGSSSAILTWVTTDLVGTGVGFGGYFSITLDGGIPIPATAPAQTYTLNNLTVGTHTITVAQCNDSGCGPSSTLTGIYPH